MDMLKKQVDEGGTLALCRGWENQGFNGIWDRYKQGTQFTII